MAAIRRAEATWSGALTSGSGEVSAISSGAFSALPVTWASRTEGLALAGLEADHEDSSPAERAGKTPPAGGGVVDLRGGRRRTGQLGHLLPQALKRPLRVA